jgi:hypothetical protein
MNAPLFFIVNNTWVFKNHLFLAMDSIDGSLFCIHIFCGLRINVSADRFSTLVYYLTLRVLSLFCLGFLVPQTHANCASFLLALYGT